MRDGKPSFTAAAVAAFRGVARVDPLAAMWVEGPLSLVLRAGRAGRVPELAINLLSLGLVDHLEMRTRAIDATLLEGIASGTRQLVVLGAGLDARAWRMKELAEVHVFEVDHPSTQAYKRSRAASRGPAAQDIRFVPVDFAKDALGAALERAGHDASAPTFWLWEGVTPYLPPPAIHATLATIAARSASGSRIAVTYATEDVSPLGTTVDRVVGVCFRWMGESLVGLMSPERMHEELASVGFRLRSDESAPEWRERFGEGRRLLLLVHEHLAVAVRDDLSRASRAA
jgi:methyltransferase (TIGR00027 family)